MTEHRATRRTFLIASGTAAVTASAGCLGGDEPERYTTPAAADFDNVVDTQWLEENIDDVKLLDVRHEDDFTESRIEGAHFFGEGEDRTYYREFVEADEGYLPDLDAVANVAERAGIDRTDDVVVYENSSNHYAMRTVVMFWAAGHEGNVYMLDGGFPVWDEADGPTASGTPDPEGGTYEVGEVDRNVIATRDWLHEYVDEDGAEVTLIDQRSGDEHLGNVDPGYHHTYTFERFGHIPGSININHPQNGVGDYDRLRSQEELEELYIDDAGLDRSEEIVTYCVSGIRSSPGLFVLSQLGFEDVRMYEGSWRDWGNLPVDEYPYSQDPQLIVDTYL